MKTFEVKFTRIVKLKVTDIIKAETAKEAIELSKQGKTYDSDEGKGTDELQDEYGHKVKEIE